MKTETILKAIDALKRSAHALRCGDLTIAQQVSLASDCGSVEWNLQHELTQALPEVKIAEAA